jgi:hypothetical protein
MKRYILISLALAGCATPGPIEMFVVGPPIPDDVIQEVGALLEVEIHIVPRLRRGVIGWTVWDDCAPRGVLHPGMEICGRASSTQRSCHRKASGISRATVIAHELGHTFWLSHRDDPLDVMHHEVVLGQATFSDRELFHENLELFNGRCRGRRVGEE